MSGRTDNPYDELERIFHEPHRLAIMSSLLGAPEGRTFTQLKAECELTDGNLNRHLKVLEDARAVRIKKRFVRNRPQTTVFLSRTGRDGFLAYLQALEAILSEAARKLEARRDTSIPHLRERFADA